MSLDLQLRELFAGLAADAPPELVSELTDGVARLAADGVAADAISVGDIAPDFALPAEKGGSHSLTDALAAGPVVVQFFRGSWCPFCNIQLGALEEIIPALHDRGAQLLAITPELPEVAEGGLSDRRPSFRILHDAGNRVAKDYGIAFRLNDHLERLHAALGSELDRLNGDAERTLPVPATFVVARDRRIVWRFLDTDYRNRAEPADILAALDAIVPQGETT